MTSDQSPPIPPADNPQPSGGRSRLLALALSAGPLTRTRCAAIALAAEALPGDDMPWIQRLAAVMDPGEVAHVQRVWVALTSAGWLDAFDLIRAAGPDRS